MPLQGVEKSTVQIPQSAYAAKTRYVPLAREHLRQPWYAEMRVQGCRRHVPVWDLNLVPQVRRRAGKVVDPDLVLERYGQHAAYDFEVFRWGG
jgi:hypothetical protein